jgi:predicted acetyltransferase
VLVREYRGTADDAELYRIRRLAFGGPREPESSKDHFSYRPEGHWALVAELDGEAVGCVRVRNYHQFFGGVAVPMGGLSTVAVDAHARGHGVANAMLDAVLPGLRERGQSISALFPSVPPLYRGRGWEQTGTNERVSLHPNALARLPKPATRPVMRRLRKDDLPAIHQAYVTYASTVDGMLDRSEPGFNHADFLDFDIVDLVPGPDGILGYLWAERTSDVKISCNDLVALDRDTALGLLHNLSLWAGNIEEISLRIIDPAWWELLIDQPVEHEKHNHPWMLRVVDLPVAVAARGWPLAAHLADLSVDIEVIDEHAPWQAGRHRLIVESGTVRCERGGSGAVQLSARALGPWYAGSADTARLRRGGLLVGDRDAARLLDVLTGAPNPVMMGNAF